MVMHALNILFSSHFLSLLFNILILYLYIYIFFLSNQYLLPMEFVVEASKFSTYTINEFNKHHVLSLSSRSSSFGNEKKKKRK